MSTAWLGSPGPKRALPAEQPIADLLGTQSSAFYINPVDPAAGRRYGPPLGYNLNTGTLGASRSLANPLGTSQQH
jgi:hypothetical protein